MHPVPVQHAAEKAAFAGRLSPQPAQREGTVRPHYASQGPEGPFSLSGLWRQSASESRLFGCVLDGDWMHVGDPGARDEAEARLNSA